MDKPKVLMVGFNLVLIVVVVAYGVYEITSSVDNPSGEEESFVRISNVAYCAGDPGDSGFSKNPPYFVGEKYYWWIRITVSADANVTDVLAYDELGEEFMVEGVSFVAIEKPGPYNYTFDYGAYESGAGVSVTDGVSVWTGYLDETGVVFDDFLVYWADESLKAHFEWDVGSMDEGEVREVYLTISTDTNSDGLQEFTSPGTYFLNSGVAVEGMIESTRKWTGAESTGIEIEVLEKTE